MSVSRLSDAQLQDRMRRVGEARQRQRDADLETMLSTPAGRRLAYRIVWDLCDIASPVASLAIKDGSCAGLHAFYADGRRSVGIELLSAFQRVAPLQWGEAVAERTRANQEDMALEMPDASSGDESP